MHANKKFLYVVGCSWSAKGGNPYHGYEGESREEKIESEDKLKWQRILSDKLNLELINDAIVGGSNDMSIKKLRNFILHDERAKNSIIIWQWTELSRYMVYSDDISCISNSFICQLKWFSPLILRFLMIRYPNHMLTNKNQKYTFFISSITNFYHSFSFLSKSIL